MKQCNEDSFKMLKQKKVQTYAMKIHLKCLNRRKYSLSVSKSDRNAVIMYTDLMLDR